MWAIYGDRSLSVEEVTMKYVILFALHEQAQFRFKLFCDLKVLLQSERIVCACLGRNLS